MNETTPDDEPEHIGRASRMWRWRPFAPRPLDVFDELACSAGDGQVVFLFGPHLNGGITLESSAKPAAVAELSSLTDDTPPSSLGLDGVFYVYEP